MEEMDCTCGKTNCYLCRRQEIDIKANEIFDREIRICYGMTGFDIDGHAAKMASQWRSKAINALAAEFAGI